MTVALEELTVAGTTVALLKLHVSDGTVELLKKYQVLEKQ